MRDGGPVAGVTRGEVVRAVEHDVGPRGERIQLGRFDARSDWHDFHIRVQGMQRGCGGVDLASADRVGSIEDLALQVGEVDLVGVCEAQPADAGSGEIQRSRAAEAARAYDHYLACAQLLLPLDPDLVEEDVAAVAEKLLVVQFVGLTCCFAASVCATVGDWLFTGSPFRKAIACDSWKSSLPPKSIGLNSAGVGAGTVRTRGVASLASLAASFFASALPFSRWRCRSASRTRVAVSLGSSTTMSGVMPSAWIERPPGV